ncbi:MAG: YIP1 family protein [Terriglobales bacterium]
MATTIPPTPEAPAPMSALARLTGVLFSPKQTFADIARKPSWVVPILLLTVLSLAVTALLMQKMDWGSFIRQKAEENPQFAQMSEEQKTSRLEVSEKITPVIVWVAGLAGPGIGALIIVLIYWGAFRLFCSADVRFGAAFGIGAHAFVPSAVASLLALVTLALKSRGDVDPERLLATNVGAFLPTDAPKWLQTLGSSLDVFMIWILALFAVGFVTASPKKVKMGTALIVVFGLWGVWVLGKVAWAAL